MKKQNLTSEPTLPSSCLPAGVLRPFRKRSRALAAVFSSILVASLPAMVAAFEPTVTKLHSGSSEEPGGDNLGTSTAMSDRYLLTGAPYSDEIADNAGSVQVFDARNGRYLRTLTAKDGAAGDQFGYGVAVCGTLAVVGAHGADATGLDSGAAYVFDLRNGRQIAKLLPDAGSSDNYFAYAVAISGETVLCGAPNDDDAANDAGAVYVFNARTGELRDKLTAEDASATAFFGEGVAVCGDLAVIGADGDDSGPGGLNSGAAYVFNLETGEELYKFHPNDASSEDYFGWPVRLNGNHAVIGAISADGAESETGAVYVFDIVKEFQVAKLIAPDGATGDQFGWDFAIEGNLILAGAWRHDANQNDTGAAYLFEAPFGDFLGKLTPPDSAENQLFGSAVALSGNRAAAGALWDDDKAGEAGAVYLYRSFSGPIPLETVARKGDFAPKSIGSDFLNFQDTFINDAGETAFQATGTRRVNGIWTDHTGALDTRTRSGQNLSPLGGDFTGTSIVRAFSPVAGYPNFVVAQALIRGQGVNGRNNRVVFATYGDMNSPLLRTGRDIFELGNAQFQTFQEVIQNANSGNVAATYRLRKGNGVTARNDSGVFVVDEFGFPVDDTDPAGARNREGESIPGAFVDVYAQFFGRVCSTYSDYFVFPAFMLEAGEGPAIQALFYDSESSGPGDIARQGEEPDDVPGAQFRSFLGETIHEDATAYRARISGPGIKGSNNEGVWSENGFLALQKGQEPDPADAPGVVVNRILGFWSMDNGDTLMILAKLRGPGVNARNDCALYLIADDGNYIQELVREGDEVCGSDCPKLGVIQRVDVNTESGSYVVLGSLVGPANANQGLLRGNVYDRTDMDGPSLRRPFLKLRKGTSYQAQGGDTTTIRSLVLPTTTDRTGAGTKGLGQVINIDGETVLCIQFNNRAKQVMTGFGEPMQN